MRTLVLEGGEVRACKVEATMAKAHSMEAWAARLEAFIVADTSAIASACYQSTGGPSDCHEGSQAALGFASNAASPRSSARGETMAMVRWRGPRNSAAAARTSAGVTAARLSRTWPGEAGDS